MSHPRRADHFKKWAQMMVEQAIVPERLEYKRLSSGGMTKSKQRRKRFRRRKRRNSRRLLNA